MSNNLDFEYLSELYKSDPVKFEEIRTQEIEKVIESASDRNKMRLRGLQFQIDAKRAIHKDSPMGSALAVSKMMHESFESLRYHLNQFTNTRDPLGHPSLVEECDELVQDKTATVLKFKG